MKSPDFTQEDFDQVHSNVLIQGAVENHSKQDKLYCSSVFQGMSGHNFQ
jgi:hypothetical protein